MNAAYHHHQRSAVETERINIQCAQRMDLRRLEMNAVVANQRSAQFNCTNVLLKLICLGKKWKHDHHSSWFAATSYKVWSQYDDGSFGLQWRRSEAPTVAEFAVHFTKYTSGWATRSHRMDFGYFTQGPLITRPSKLGAWIFSTLGIDDRSHRHQTNVNQIRRTIR